MRRVLATLVALSGAFAVGLPAIAQQMTTPSGMSQAQIDAQDQDFATFASSNDQGEISLAQMALQKGSPTVKQLAQTLMDDHAASARAMQQAAQGLGIVLTTSLLPKHAAIANQLAQLTGADFDRAFLQAQVQGHQEAIARFQQEVTQSTNPTLKAFASQQIPVLQQHLNLAQDALSGLGSIR